MLSGLSELTKMSISATLHCLLGCSIGEVAGLLIGTALGLANLPTFILSIVLAFISGYTLSILPLLKAGLALATALPVILAADTLSIISMEIADNGVMAVIPGAMNAGLGNWIFWATMPLSLAVGFVVAVPVNRFLLARGKGHALVHEYHHGSHDKPSRGQNLERSDEPARRNGEEHDS